MQQLAIEQFRQHLVRQERSIATVEKYIRDTRGFLAFIDGKELSKDLTMQYKEALVRSGYAVRSINSMLAAVNSFLEFMNRRECLVKTIKLQKEVYCREDRLLTKAEYMRLLDAAKAHPRLFLLLQTICGTGIRISELSHFTVEAVRQGEVVVYCKSKTRTILLPKKLRSLLLAYAKQVGICTGVIFRTRMGHPLDRSNIWSEMKRLCGVAKVNPSKVFPHNLRKLFARTFYSIERDIAKLADILGHSSIDTTRIYIMTAGGEHQRKIDRLGLILQ